MNIDQLCSNTIRILSAEGVQKANSGHPGLPLGAAPMIYTLWAKHMKHNPKDPQWLDRDRFVLSAGHGSMLLYSMLHLFQYGLSVEDLKNFRQLDSKTPGHPEYGHTQGVETTTGPLGQGIATAVGMAMAETHLAARFNQPDCKIVDHYTYVLTGDGCMMEGISAEAASLAGTLKLGKLIALYDSNSITIEGNTAIAFTEDVEKRFQAYGWQTINVEDGNDIEAISNAIEVAKDEISKPSLIIVKTQIGYGCPAKQGTNSAHGEPLGEENIKEMKLFLNWKEKEAFEVPESVRQHMNKIISKGFEFQNEWKNRWQQYKIKYPNLAAQWEVENSGELPMEYLDSEEYWNYEKSIATRAASGEVIQRLAEHIPNFIGGSADLAPSTKTWMNNRETFSHENYAGSNIHFGVREHAMGAILNGMAVHGGLHVFGATFFVFSDYIKPAMRLSALMNLPVTYVLTHDSIGVGEDGPTHQPIEQLGMLRCMPNMIVFRPADGKETVAGWYVALTRKEKPTALVLTRQDLPLFEESGKEALKGGYIMMKEEKEKPDIILMASGSEVSLIYEAANKLKTKGIHARVISMPSWELFEEQPEDYRDTVLPKNVKTRLAVEAGASLGWHKYVGIDGKVIALDRFGASGPATELLEKFGFTVDNIVNQVLQLVQKSN